MGNFSKEYLFKINVVQNHALGVRFNIGSSARNRYGDFIVVNLLLEEDEKSELFSNIFKENPPINTEGYLRAKQTHNQGLTEEQVELLESEGFHTSEVLEILHV